MLETITTTWSNWRENVIQPLTQPKVYYFIQVSMDVMILNVIQIIIRDGSNQFNLVTHE